MQILLNQFITAKMDPADSMVDHVAKIISLAQRLKDMDMEQKSLVVIAKILSSLPAKYDNVRTAWYAVAKDKQTLETFTDHLVNEESLLNQRKQEEPESSEEVYFARGKRNNNKGRKLRDNNNSSRNEDASRQKNVR